MQQSVTGKPRSDDISQWFALIGRAGRFFVSGFSRRSFGNLSWAQYIRYCRWMGINSFFLLSLSSVLVGIALTLQTVVEMEKYGAQDYAGAVISIGLLREIAPLTVSLSWCLRVAAYLSLEANASNMTDREYAGTLFLSRYLAALTVAVPLSAYGLVIGYLTGAFSAPVFSVSSASDFIESGRQAIHNKDLAVFFVKVALVNPSVAVTVGCLAGLIAPAGSPVAASNAVTAVTLGCFALNLCVSLAAYVR